MEFSVWLALVALFLAGGLTPGPAVMLVTSSSLRYGFWPSMLAAVGVSSANLFWIALAASGAAALAGAYPTAFLILKLAGVGFILWLAWTMTRSSDPIIVRTGSVPRASVLYLKGMLLQLANPNALVFFGGLLPAYIDADRPLIDQASVMVATVTVTEMAGLAIYAFAADTLSRRFTSPTFAQAFNRIAAALMAGSAIFALIVTSR